MNNESTNIASLWKLTLGIFIIVIGYATAVFGGGVQTLETVEITDSTENLVGSADSATEGTIMPKQIEDRPLLRTGEILEDVPGLIISQHSGEGKANQYYLRGFNLDHGTDMATTMAGMPINEPTHAHGQGYTDLNFLMPELLSGVQYKKGPYYADQGDFSAAGAVIMDYRNVLERNIAVVGMGTEGYRRILVAGSPELAGGHLLYGFEAYHHDGPWVNPDNYNKLNGVLRYSRGDGQNSFSITAMGYNGTWNATNQVALRAIDEGLISRYGSLSPTDAGNSYRYSLSVEGQQTSENGITRENAYVIKYQMNLWNNFEYDLEDQVNGDQFHQYDNRVTSGFNVSHDWITKLAGLDMVNTIGLQVRNDDINPVGLYHTVDQQLISVTEQDHVIQTSGSIYVQNRFQWSEKFRSIAGLREDYYYWDVMANNPLNSGEAHGSLLSPKLSLIFGPWEKTEYYINAGQGFHSNDGRGATMRVDPLTGEPTSKVTPLVRAEGLDIGARTAVIPHAQSELTFWALNLGSELVFDGDHGITTPSYASHRYGLEWANYYTPTSWFTLDADLALSHARFVGDPVGPYIPGSPEVVASAGASVDSIDGYLGSLRMRYFGPRPLYDDDSVRSNASTIVDARIGYKFSNNWRIFLDCFNLFNAQVSDIDYFYVSRLPGEPPAGVADISTHPADPREFRLTLAANF
ncbi:MAG TPA: TonB-dependent receptor [Nitrospirota bacterium]|nr:TonB-dependent receptor [Nitrospirota bacterium]